MNPSTLNNISPQRVPSVHPESKQYLGLGHCSLLCANPTCVKHDQGNTSECQQNDALIHNLQPRQAMCY